MEKSKILQAKERIQQASAKAAMHMNAIRSQDSLSRDYFDHHLRSFVLEKFHLTEVELPSDNFDEIVDLSLARTMQISPDLVEEFDQARDCQSASSATSKKVLLFMTIQRELSITLPAQRSAYIETFQDLCDLCWEQVEGKALQGS